MREGMEPRLSISLEKIAYARGNGAWPPFLPRVETEPRLCLGRLVCPG
jgi:hypothetical protein